MKTLSKVIVDVAAFLELSGDEVIDPDSAIKTMEMIRSELKEATPEEKKAIAAAATAAAVSACSRDASEVEIEFFEEFMENFDILDVDEENPQG